MKQRGHKATYGPLTCVKQTFKKTIENTMPNSDRSAA